MKITPHYQYFSCSKHHSCLRPKTMPRTTGVERQSPSPQPRIHQTHPHDTPVFRSTVSQRNLSRFNYTILIFRLTSFCFSLSAAVFMFTINITAAADSPRWYNFGAFRFIVAANAIVSFYSLFEIVASVWEIYRGFTLFPECSQVWFDFGHDQVFAYLLLSAGSAGTELVRQLREVATCSDNNEFCIQIDIALALGYACFLSLLISSLLSGFRVVCFIIKGSRFLL